MHLVVRVGQPVRIVMGVVFRLDLVCRRHGDAALCVVSRQRRTRKSRGKPGSSDTASCHGCFGVKASKPGAGATRRAPLKRFCQYACRMSSTRTVAPARGAWMNLPSPT